MERDAKKRWEDAFYGMRDSVRMRRSSCLPWKRNHKYRFETWACRLGWMADVCVIWAILIGAVGVLTVVLAAAAWFFA